MKRLTKYIAENEYVSSAITYPNVSYVQDVDETRYKLLSIFSGKFTDDSTESDWWLKINGSSENVSISNYVEKETKEFNFVYEYEVVSIRALFQRNSKIEKIYDIRNTYNVTNAQYMFDGCSGLTELELSSFCTSNITNMFQMFNNCINLASLNLNSFNTSKVTNIGYMFANCRSLTYLNVNNFDTSNVNNTFYMFSGCRSLTSLDLNNFNMSKVTNMNGMFNGCNSLTSLYVSNWDTSNVTTMTNMFNGCGSLTHIKCKQAFKDWCITNQDTIGLPDSMREGGGGTWEIVG